MSETTPGAGWKVERLVSLTPDWEEVPGNFPQLHHAIEGTRELIETRDPSGLYRILDRNGKVLCYCEKQTLPGGTA
jgi:hypothetical protein